MCPALDERLYTSDAASAVPNRGVVFHSVQVEDPAARAGSGIAAARASVRELPVKAAFPGVTIPRRLKIAPPRPASAPQTSGGWSQRTALRRLAAGEVPRYPGSGKPQREQPGMALGLRSRLGARHAGQGRRLSAPSRGSTRAKPTLAQTLAPSDGGRPAPGPCHRDIICHSQTRAAQERCHSLIPREVRM